MKPLRIALIGSRGIPARYGGYETLLQEIAVRLQDRGHAVTVYCRSRYTARTETTFRGVRLVVLPTIPTKHLDTPVHTLLSCVHAMGRYDAALVVNGANALFVPILRLGRVPSALHVDGIEKRRAKWGPVGRAVYALSERLATRFPNILVTDADVIQEHYRQRYGADSWMITYGVDSQPPTDLSVLDRLSIEPRRFFLYVSRFEPENNPHRVVDAYRQAGGDLPLVMVGDAPYADRFIRDVRERADPRVLFPGAIYGEGYRALMANALAYVQATEVGGTHPALVEAMGFGNCVLFNDAPENREVVGDAGLPFRASDPASLAEHFDALHQTPEAAAPFRRAARQRAQERFDWERVTDRYAALFAALAGDAAPSAIAES